MLTASERIATARASREFEDLRAAGIVRAVPHVFACYACGIVDARTTAGGIHCHDCRDLEGYTVR